MLAIAGGKGGCGKTTTALGLARALVRRGRHPLVVDCDSDMPNLHHVAEVDGPGGVDALAAGAPIEWVRRESAAVPGVGIVTAGTRDAVDGTLRRLQRWHGPVLLDCPPGIGPDAVGPLRHAASTLLVTEARPQSMTDARSTARSARVLGADPAGVLVRDTPGERSCEWPASDPACWRVPTVSTPLEHPRVRAVWADLAASLSPDLGLKGATDSPVPGNKTRGKRRQTYQ